MGFLAVVALFLSHLACASPNDNSSSDLMSLNFYPHLHVFYVNPHITTSLRDEAPSSNNTDQHISFSQLYLGFSYGLLPGLRLGLNDTILWDQVTESATTGIGQQTAVTTAGPSNPTLLLTWRCLESAATGLSGDLTVNGSPSLGRRVSADAVTGTIGTNYSGGTSAGGSATLFWRWWRNELAAQSSVTRNFGFDTHGTTFANSSTTAPAWTSSWSLRDRLHFGARYFFGATLTQHLDSRTQTQIDTGVTRAIHLLPYSDPSFDFGYRPDPYVVIFATFGFNHSATETALPDGTVTYSETKLMTAQVTFQHQFW